MSLEPFDGTRKEYIAEHEKYPAWSATLYFLSNEDDLPETLEITELRKKIQDCTGFPFSELALRLALEGDGETFKLASPVSTSETEKYFTLDRDKLTILLHFLPQRKENSLWRLQNVPHDSFRAEVNGIRTTAAKKYDEGLERGHVWSPRDGWSDFGFEYMFSYIENMSNENAPNRADQTPLLPRVGSLASKSLILTAAGVTIVVGYFTLQSFGVL